MNRALLLSVVLLLSVSSAACVQEKPAKAAPCACEAGKGARSGGGGMRSR